MTSKEYMGQSGGRHAEGFRKSEMHEQGGLIRLNGKFLLDHEEEIVNLIKHEGSLAEAENTEHRVDDIKKVDGGLVVQVSNSRLAMHIGKCLNHAYKGTHTYKFSKGEKYVEVDWARD